MAEGKPPARHGEFGMAFQTDANRAASILAGSDFDERAGVVSEGTGTRLLHLFIISSILSLQRGYHFLLGAVDSSHRFE